MRNLKRALSLTLASVMLLGMMVVGAGAAGYPDVNADDHDIEAIEVLQAVKVMQGNDQGNFDPDSPVNRSQMAVVMANLLNLDYNYYEASCPFWDVPDWAKPYVAACYANGIVSGYNATTYGAADSVTAVQAASMMMRALGYFKYQEDYDQNGGFELATVKQANQIGLFDGLNANATAALTRNQVAKLALNALEANMVNFTGTPGTSIDLGDGKKVNVGYKGEYTFRSGTEKKYAAMSDLGDTTNVIGSGAQGRYYVQLGEELYNGKLTKAPSFDEFDRPTTTWRYDYSKIGQYLNTPDKVYTKEVKLGDIYSDLGLPADLAINNVLFFDNGMSEADGIVDNGSVKLENVGLGRNTANKIGKNGVLTQVWYYKDTNTARITQVDTYVGKIASVVNANASDRYVTLTGHSFSSAAFPTAPTLSNRFETSDFASKDLVIFTAAYNHDSSQFDIQTVESLELSATGLLTRWEGNNKDSGADVGWANNNFTAGGTKYNYSINNLVVDEDGGIKAIKDFDVNKSDVNVYLDKYGYAIYVSGVEGTKNYAALIGFGAVNQYGSQTRGATLLLPDGTQQEVIAKLPTGQSWTDNLSVSGTGVNNENLVSDGIGDVVTYTVGDDGVYTLTVVNTQNPSITTTPAPAAHLTGKYSADAKNVNTSFLNGRSLMEINTKYADVENVIDGYYTTATKGNYYTTSETIFFVATLKDPLNPSKGYNYDVYTGYANAPSLDDPATTVNGIAFAMDSFYTNQINAVYIDATRTAGISDVDTYFVKKEKATIYTDSDGKYFELPAIVNGEATTIRIDADTVADWNGDGTTAVGETLASENGTAYLFAIKNVTKNSKGIINGCTQARLDNAATSVFNAANGVAGTVNTRVAVLGVGGSEGTATYWSYRDTVKAYRVDKDYKTISVIAITDIGTDPDDLVYAIHDNGAPEKKLTDVVVVEQSNGGSVPHTIQSSTGVQFSSTIAGPWSTTLGNKYKNNDIYVVADDVTMKPVYGSQLTLVGFTATNQGIYTFKMPNENIPTGSFTLTSTGYSVTVPTLTYASGNTVTLTGAAVANSAIQADATTLGVTPGISYKLQELVGGSTWADAGSAAVGAITVSGAPNAKVTVRVAAIATINGAEVAVGYSNVCVVTIPSP